MIEQIDGPGGDNADNGSPRGSEADAMSSNAGGSEASESEAEEELALMFNIKLDRNEPTGTKLSKRATMCVHI